MPREASAPATPITPPPRQPFTFGGVARFGNAGIGRVFGMALAFALLGGGALGLVFGRCWSPVLSQAIAALPATSRISNGQLEGAEAKLLGANNFLAIAMAESEAGSADLVVKLQRTEITFSSLAGFISISYPKGLTLPLNRTELVPLWGAWQAPCVFWTVLGGAIVLILIWCALALVYAFAALLIAGLARRSVNYWRAWKLSVAAQWPGSLIMSFGLALYSTGQMSLLFLGIMFAAHFVPTLIYVLLSPLFLPKPGLGRANPFNPAKAATRRRKNPFS